MDGQIDEKIKGERSARMIAPRRTEEKGIRGQLYRKRSGSSFLKNARRSRERLL